MLTAVDEQAPLISEPKHRRVENIEALVQLLTELKVLRYRFTAITPVTHKRVLANRSGAGENLSDVFGWNMPFAPEVLPANLRNMLNEAQQLSSTGSLLHSGIRVATMGEDLFLHSGFPTTEADAVFFGPDTYRFARFIQHELRGRSHLIMRNRERPFRILDVGCGSGAGGITAARALTLPDIELVMNDINARALAYTSINAQAAGVPVVLAQGDALAAVDGEFDLIISNPPYLEDSAGRAYRHGGARLGRALSVRIAEEAINRLAPGGQLLLYTGVAMVEDTDPFIAELEPLLRTRGYQWSYEEIDPDIFGEELERPAYRHAHRIAAVGLVVIRPQV